MDNKKTILPECATTSIGSFPHTNPEKLCHTILQILPQIPVWPQLPKRSYLEGMYVQYSEGIPLLQVDEDSRKIYFRREEKFKGEVEEFYNKCLEGDLDYFKVTDKYARGLYTLFGMWQTIREQKHLWIKGQVTGPVSFGLSVTDEERKPSLYNENLKEIILLGLTMKARWQIKLLRKIYSRVMLFIDEPYISGVGSGIINLKPNEILKDLTEIITEIKINGALTGVHCCGNTDWSLLLKTGLDILSFDAYNYGENVLLFGEDLRNFLKNGGLLAWGITPTSGEPVEKEVLIKRIESLFLKLKKKGFSVEDVLRQSLITPSCGMASLSEKQSEHLLHITNDLSIYLKEKYLC